MITVHDIVCLSFTWTSTMLFMVCITSSLSSTWCHNDVIITGCHGDFTQTQQYKNKLHTNIFIYLLCYFQSIMPQFSLQECLWIVEQFYLSFGKGRNGGPSIVYVQQLFETTFKKKPPVKCVIHGIIKQFKNTGSV